MRSKNYVSEAERRREKAALCVVRTQESAGENEDEKRREKADFCFDGRAGLASPGFLCVDENMMCRFSGFPRFWLSAQITCFYVFLLENAQWDLDECVPSPSRCVTSLESSA
jgi:hypothetical protein